MSIDDNADPVLKSAQRIVVLGCSGSGKSTLSRKLAEKLGLSYVSMDREFFWLPGWKLRDRAEIRRMISETAAGERWIMDGNSPGTLDIRLPRAGAVIWLRLSRYLCLYRVVRRWWRHAGKTRPDMAEGCPEKIDLEFLRYIWNFESRETPEIARAIETYGPEVPVFVLRSRSDADALLARLDTEV